MTFFKPEGFVPCHWVDPKKSPTFCKENRRAPLTPVQENAQTEAIKQQGLIDIAPDYLSQKTKAEHILKSAFEKLKGIQEKGENCAIANQLYIYAKWLVNYTSTPMACVTPLQEMLARLERPDRNAPLRQCPDDGSWGEGYSEFHHKLDITTDMLNECAAKGTVPERPLSFLEPVATAPRMLAYLEALRTSEIATTGRDQRDEFGGIISCLAQICFKPKLRHFVESNIKGIELTQHYVDLFRTFLFESQNQQTGFWGQSYRHDATLYRYHDLSYTFHLISYLKGKVPNWPKILETTFALKDGNYPGGWLKNGQQNNHNNYDVAKILRLGWDYLNDHQKHQARCEIEQMLDWCLTQSMDEAGNFLCDGGFCNSVSARTYFGVSFLDEIGFFDPDKRFWRSSPLAQSDSITQKILNRLEHFHGPDDKITSAKRKILAAIPTPLNAAE